MKKFLDSILNLFSPKTNYYKVVETLLVEKLTDMSELASSCCEAPQKTHDICSSLAWEIVEYQDFEQSLALVQRFKDTRPDVYHLAKNSINSAARSAESEVQEERITLVLAAEFMSIELLEKAQKEALSLGEKINHLRQQCISELENPRSVNVEAAIELLDKYEDNSRELLDEVPIW